MLQLEKHKPQKFIRLNASRKNFLLHILAYTALLDHIPYPQRIAYRVFALVRRCTEGLAPPYLRELCCPTVTVPRRGSLRSAVQAEFLVPVLGLLAIRQRRAFSVAAVAWNGLPVALRLTSIDRLGFPFPRRICKMSGRLTGCQVLTSKNQGFCTVMFQCFNICSAACTWDCH